jgi:L-asparagine oxygenase
MRQLSADSQLDAPVAHPPVRAISVDTTHWNELTAMAAGRVLDLERLVTVAGHAARLLPPTIHDALVDFGDAVSPSGALLIRGVPVGELPLTPTQRGATGKTDQVSELVLLTIARRLGQPVGYAPEHGGALVQNLIPLADTRAAQVSTSSDVDLFFHTETAFHPYRPRYLVLLCLRGDPTATTTLCSVGALVEHLSADEQSVLRQTRFRIGVDASFGGTRANLGEPVAVLSGRADEPTLLFDADLMIGTDTEAEAVLQRLVSLVARHATGVVLEAGDVLVIDNTAAVHGRSPFAARFDGTDRWLQRAFVVNDLAPSARERTGRIITKRW